jgi:hypothetical protein
LPAADVPDGLKVVLQFPLASVVGVLIAVATPLQFVAGWLSSLIVTAVGAIPVDVPVMAVVSP